MAQKPVIGITLDHEEKDGYSKFPWYALREHYTSSIHETGGIPLPMPHYIDLVDDYINMVDGIVVTGGDFDVDPNLYGATDIHPSIKVKSRRTSFELEIIKRALEKNIPLLGICGGHQLLNVALGGTLIQHIPEEFTTDIKHEQPNSREEPGHEIRINHNSILHKIVGSEVMSVNSAHHQAIKSPGRGCVVNAVAPDGMIEGIEVQDKRFCMGIQWHPEIFVDPGDRLIFEFFIRSARG